MINDMVECIDSTGSSVKVKHTKMFINANHPIHSNPIKKVAEIYYIIGEYIVMCLPEK